MQTAYLTVKDPQGERQVPLDGGMLTIGRNFTNLLVIEETMASRFHCVIEQLPEGFLLRDLDSRNGTIVNGKPIKQCPLANGDVVTIGKTELKLIVPNQKSHPSVPTKQVVDEAVAELAHLVNDEEEDESAVAVADEKIEPANEYEKALRERAESLADHAFGERDIVLINTRGKVAHERGARDVGEAVTLLRLMMLICFRSRATDMHVEPKMDDVTIRVRVDGALVDVIRISKELGTKFLSAVKVLADIDIAHRNIVQEGHFSARVPQKKDKVMSERRVDYRVSFAPAVHGQKLVIRVLDTANSPLHIDDLQLPLLARQFIRRTSEQESGMILVCGPTGSGKTTTLYAILRDIDVAQRNVVTIEDPVEIQLEGVTQIPVNEGQGNSFSALLRSVLRQDPDVILIGEIRDAETARVGVQAGMTGHLVLSTVHSRDTVSGIFRLLDLAVEPYVVASGLHVVMAQRLVRQLCAHCKTAKAPTAQQQKRLAAHGFKDVKQIYQPKGCKKCLGTGHLGRRGIFEVLNTNSSVRDAVLRNPSVQECRKYLNAENFIPMSLSAYQLVAEGVACIEEIDKIISESA